MALVLIPHSDNTWIDPQIVTSLAKQPPTFPEEDPRWSVYIGTNQHTIMGEPRDFAIRVATREEADEAIDAIIDALRTMEFARIVRGDD